MKIDTYFNKFLATACLLATISGTMHAAIIPNVSIPPTECTFTPTSTATAVPEHEPVETNAASTTLTSETSPIPALIPEPLATSTPSTTSADSTSTNQIFTMRGKDPARTPEKIAIKKNPAKKAAAKKTVNKQF